VLGPGRHRLARWRDAFIIASAFTVIATFTVSVIIAVDRAEPVHGNTARLLEIPPRYIVLFAAELRAAEVHVERRVRDQTRDGKSAVVCLRIRQERVHRNARLLMARPRWNQVIGDLRNMRRHRHAVCIAQVRNGVPQATFV